uniref:Uncharacterized protein n=1 Tax=Pararge aegeria TaxID=116150 RepID=S4PL63_9NEOP
MHKGSAYPYIFVRLIKIFHFMPYSFIIHTLAKNLVHATAIGCPNMPQYYCQFSVYIVNNTDMFEVVSFRFPNLKMRKALKSINTY